MKTAISIPDVTFKRAERFARRAGMSRSQLYTRAVATFIDARAHEDTIEALNRIYSTQSSTLDPVLVSLQAAALGKDDW